MKKLTGKVAVVTGASKGIGAAIGIAGSDFEKGAVAQTPLGRVGQPDDIARVAVFLASDNAQWVTGELLRAGGHSMKLSSPAGVLTVCDSC